MRAAYDERGAAVSRLREAAGLAAAQGSVALLRRCERDLAALGVRPALANILRPPEGPARRTLRERRVPSVGVDRFPATQETR